MQSYQLSLYQDFFKISIDCIRYRYLRDSNFGFLEMKTENTVFSENTVSENTVFRKYCFRKYCFCYFGDANGTPINKGRHLLPPLTSYIQYTIFPLIEPPPPGGSNFPVPKVNVEKQELHYVCTVALLEHLQYVY